jgi:hypothetical protein
MIINDTTKKIMINPLTKFGLFDIIQI